MKLSFFFVGFLLSGCALISDDHEKWRLDPDADGIKWPIDCDDNNETVTVFTWYRDRDQDGYGEDSTGVCQCSKPGLDYVEQGGDCDDDDASVFPAATEICDEIDNDCNNKIDDEDEGLSLDETTAYYLDEDNDGYGTALNPVQACQAPEGYAAQADDCDDTNADINPGKAEICDEIDNNCNDQIDEGFADGPFYLDSDGDGFGDVNTPPVEDCSGGEGSYVEVGNDCDDSNADINPAAEEICDGGIDNNCDELIDDETASDAQTWFKDNDADGYGDSNAITVACSQPSAAHTQVDGDCDDSESATFPGAAELESATECMSDVDNDGYGDSSPLNTVVTQGTDCDDEDMATYPGIAINEANAEACMTDADADGYGDENPANSIVVSGTDCHDEDQHTYPGAAESEDDAAACMTDSDEDGYGDENPTTGVATGSDCDDDDVDINPAADEIWYDGIDQNCNDINAGDDYDADGDGYLSAQEAFNGALGSDCDDEAANAYPGAAEFESSIACMLDEDGDGYGDENPVNTDVSPGFDCDDASTTAAYSYPGAAYMENQNACMTDQDGDGWGSQFVVNGVTGGTDCDDVSAVAVYTFPGAAPADSQSDCMTDADGDQYGDENPATGVTSGTDCDDSSATAAYSYPGAASAEDQVACMTDQDGDGWGSQFVVNGVTGGADCDDFDQTISPDAQEIPADGVDQDCDTFEDCYTDNDGDSYGSSIIIESSNLQCANLGESAIDGDCDDNDSTINPDATEIPNNTVDEDCDGALGQGHGNNSQ